MSSVQRPASRVQRPEYNGRVLRPKSSVQCPASKVQRPTLALESKNSSMPFSSLILSRSSRPKVFFKTGALKDFAKFTGKYLVFSYRFCEIFKKTYFQEHLRTTASIAGFSYAETWKLLNLFVRTNIFSYHICYEN